MIVVLVSAPFTSLQKPKQNCFMVAIEKLPAPRKVGNMWRSYEMKIKAIAECRYGDDKKYYRKCHIISFAGSDYDYCAIVLFFNGTVKRINLEDLTIIDEDYLPSMCITEEEDKKYQELRYSSIYKSDYIYDFMDGFIQADEYKKRNKINDTV